MPLFLFATLDFKFISHTPWILLNRISIVKSPWCLSSLTQSQQLSAHKFTAQFLAVPPFHLLCMFSMQLNAWIVSLLHRLHPRHSLRLNPRCFLPLRLQYYLPLSEDLAVAVIPQMIAKGVATSILVLHASIALARHTLLLVAIRSGDILSAILIMYHLHLLPLSCPLFLLDFCPIRRPI